MVAGPMDNDIEIRSLKDGKQLATLRKTSLGKISLTYKTPLHILNARKSKVFYQ